MLTEKQIEVDTEQKEKYNYLDYNLPLHYAIDKPLCRIELYIDIDYSRL